MRGFLAVWDGARAGLSDPLRQRLGNWIRKRPAGGLISETIGALEFHLYSDNATPPDYNVSVGWTHGGAMRVWRLGPRISLENDAEGSARADGSDGEETVIAIRHDPESGALEVRTDCLNSTYVYYASLNGALLLSGSSRLLAALLGSKYDETAAAEFLLTGSVFGNQSLRAGIRFLPPSSVCAWKPGSGMSTGEYWRISGIPFGTLSLQEGKERILGALDRDYMRLAGSGSRLVLDLTGGFDSRCNFGLALRNRLGFRTTVSGRPGDGDVDVATRLAHRYGIPLEVALPFDGDDAARLAWVARAMEYTDGEYDAVEFAEILQVHTAHFREGEGSMHGSTADVMRNYFLLPGFYENDPEGKLAVDNLVRKKFSPAVDPATGLRAGLMPDWVGHMRARIAQYDQPDLPAYARLDIIYLRIRMQFWQGRIASSTNRLHGSFTPWTNFKALEAILAVNWREKRHARLSRALLSALHPGLDRIPLSSPNIPGLGAVPVLISAPTIAAYYAEKVRERALRRFRKGRPRASSRQFWDTRSVVSRLASRMDAVESLLPDAVLLALRKGVPHPALMNYPFACRLFTLALGASLPALD